MTSTRVYGIDLGTTYTCIAKVDEASGKPQITPNAEGELTTPSVVMFDDAETVVVGLEAKGNAVLEVDKVIEMIKRQIGKPEWRQEFFGKEYSPEEISSYIIRKVVDDAERLDGTRPQKVVITCPAYFDSQQREATAAAGRIAGIEVLEIINEPTAAAITYGAQETADQVVLVYDLGGGTFDITVIKIENGAITVVATGGDDQLGGRDWDELLVAHLAEKWKADHPESTQNPLDSLETVQDLRLKAESAKRALTSRTQTRITVTHDAKPVAVVLTRETFDELTAPLLENTVLFTRKVLETASGLGHPRIDQLLLVGGSTKMPQVAERLRREFEIEVKSFDPDHAVAKGAAIYGQKLEIGERIRIEIGKRIDLGPTEIDLRTASPEVVKEAEEKVATDMGLKLGTVQKLTNMSVTNVLSHSFGVVAWRDESRVIANLVLAQTPLPAESTQKFGTRQDAEPVVELTVMENTVRDKIVDDLNKGKEVGQAVLEMTAGLPANSRVEVTFQLDGQGRLTITGRDESEGGKVVTATIDTNRVLSAEQMEDAIRHARGIKVIG